MLSTTRLTNNGIAYATHPGHKPVSDGLAPLTIGLVTAGGYVMARTTDAGWQGASATALMLFTKINPLWILATGGALGVLGIL